MIVINKLNDISLKKSLRKKFIQSGQKIPHGKYCIAEMAEKMARARGTSLCETLEVYRRLGPVLDKSGISPFGTWAAAWAVASNFIEEKEVYEIVQNKKREE